MDPSDGSCVVLWSNLALDDIGRGESEVGGEESKPDSAVDGRLLRLTGPATPNDAALIGLESLLLSGGGNSYCCCEESS
jgi:hypothetical protein